MVLLMFSKEYKLLPFRILKQDRLRNLEKTLEFTCSWTFEC